MRCANALALALAAGACSRADLAPRIDSVEPGWGDTAAPTPVVIRGAFRVKAAQSLSAASGDALDATYQAWLDGAPLEQLRWLDAGSLAAVVPAGLAPGPHRLEVQDPSGRRGALAGAFFAGIPTVVLSQVVAPSATLLSVGQAVVVSVEVANGGNATARGLLPALALGGPGALTATTVPGARDLAAGATARFDFGFVAAAAGAVAVDVATAVPSPTGGTAAAPPWSGILLVQAPAALSLVLGVSRSVVHVGQPFALTLTVHNPGTAGASGVVPGPPVASGAGAVLLQNGPTPAAQLVPGGQSATFTWDLLAVGAGEVSFAAGASGADANSGALLLAGPATSPSLQVVRPAALAATLSIPPVLAAGAFTATLTVENSGGAAALGVAPGALTVVAGSAASAAEAAPFGAPQDIPGGEARTFRADWTASGAGLLRLQGGASGIDAVSGAPVAAASVASNAATVGSPPVVTQLAVDPLGDGSPFAFVNGWEGAVLVGPNRTGRSAALLGTGAPALVSFALEKDESILGSTSRNGWAGAPPYPSLGSSACLLGGQESCGPDNENARGMLSVETIGGAEWAVAGQGRLLGDVRYAYLAPAGAGPLAFRYLDLTRVLSEAAWGHTAVAVHDDVLYLGLAGARPQLLALYTLPTAPGLDANEGVDADDLGLDAMPGLGGSGTPANGAPTKLVDSLASFGGMLYAANNGGLVRSTVARPLPYTARSAHWAPSTPSAPSYAAKSSITSFLGVAIEPRHRAFPALAAWQGRLLAIRNTADGPQLWRCDPAAAGDATACDPGDWSLAAPNAAGDPALTQLGDPGATRATLLAATPAWLYVGLEGGAAGVRVFRTSAAAPASAGDFLGEGGCLAGAAGCQGLGGDGLGDPPHNTRILDARALAPGGASGLYFTTGNGIDPVRVYRILD